MQPARSATFRELVSNANNGGRFAAKKVARLFEQMVSISNRSSFWAAAQGETNKLENCINLATAVDLVLSAPTRAPRPAFRLTRGYRQPLMGARLRLRDLAEEIRRHEGGLWRECCRVLVDRS